MLVTFSVVQIPFVLVFNLPYSSRFSMKRSYMINCGIQHMLWRSPRARNEWEKIVGPQKDEDNVV